ncbi:MAG: hypothetical protein K6B41_14370 [Butyrivibrio sp.]|nr:hypothetical protein [Butyrivibrio sp.]
MSKEKSNRNVSDKLGNNKRQNFAPVVISICAGVSILVLAVAFSYHYITSRQVGRSSVSTNKIVSADNVESMLDDIQNQRGTAGSYNAVMNTTWEFEDGAKSSSNAYVENSTSNINTVYFTVTLDGTDELIYLSPYIEVGKALKDIKLDKDLDAGTYNALLTYHLIDDNKNELSTVSVNLIIKVAN